MTTAEPGPNRNHPAAVGALAEEAGQLLDAVAVKLARMKQEAPDGPEPVSPADEPESQPHGSAVSCVGWCPICRSAELLKGDRSETTQKLVDAALLVVTTLRSLIPASTGEADRSAPDGDGSPGMERIDIR